CELSRFRRSDCGGVLGDRPLRHEESLFTGLALLKPHSTTAGSRSLREKDKALIPERFGDSTYLIDSIAVAEFGGRLIHELRGNFSHGRPSGSLVVQREPIDRAANEEAIKAATCLLKVNARVDIKFTLTAKLAAANDGEDAFVEL
ncbi:hypothetical protein Tco_0726574, partial [Tanacetum coccineum]